MRQVTTFVWIALAITGCFGRDPIRGGDRPGDGAGDGGTSATRDASPGDPAMRRDGSFASRDAGPPDVGPDPEAFWADDPPPRTCLPDGGMGVPPDPPGGTPECPDDKNREGCRCETIGETAPCWPGLRVDRNRGICMDGTTRCEPYDEFTGRWGACIGYVLPVPGFERGPEACGCFSAGSWEIDNLSPCFVEYGAGRVYAVSTFIDATGNASCPTSLSSTPPPRPEPGRPWSTNRLTVDCAGRFRLCYRLRAGDVEAPAGADCVVAESCTEAWYAEAGVAQELPPLPGWSGTDPVCAQRFRDAGGYGEMTVLGLSIECDPVDDGAGAEYVFNRTGYCPLRCLETPDLPECERCEMGGSGSF